MNIELSKNNHFTWGYNETPWTDRTTLYDKFFIQYGKVSYISENFRKVCVETAREISQEANRLKKRPLIYYSGGIDSESIIAAFLESNQDFSVAHIRFQPNLNAHETKYVEKFSNKHNLDLVLFDVYPEEYLQRPKTMFTAIRDNSRMIELQLMTSIIKDIKERYFPVLDHPGTYLYRNNVRISEPSQWFWKDYESLMFYYNYCKHESLPSCPSFYHWSPEIILSFLIDPLIRDLVTNKTYGKLTNRTTTTLLYQSTFPDYELETRPKFTGFEYLSKKFLRSLNYQLISEIKYPRYSGQIFEYYRLIEKLGYYDH
jgi:hypothetical protein